MTYSMAAFDPATGQLGVVVQSKAFTVGSMVPWALPGVGAVATQANVNIHFGPRGLDLLKEGLAPDQVIERLLADDEGRKVRQIGVVDARGRSANYTGENCLRWAGALHGENWTCQGNILTGPRVVEAMAEAYTRASGSLADRLLAALSAGQEAGGDARGMQSAALLVVGENSGHPEGRLIDLRVDDHHAPIEELHRLYHIHQKLHENWSSEWCDYAGDLVLIAEQLMQMRQIASLQKLAEALHVPDAIHGRKISSAFRRAIFEERQK
ncbi:MAG TPA: DUF1028 domain-containing protein [Symbiobacteriaceae bacterium]|nr:DUF1028 domain-containing protein [Symbiobacteriaceae bacterium]